MKKFQSQLRKKDEFWSDQNTAKIFFDEFYSAWA